MKVPLLVAAFAFLASVSHAQYFQYSQYDFTSPRVNPANIGNTGYATLSLDSRNQKTGGDFNIKSNFTGVEYPLLHAGTGHPWSGIAITAMDDRSGGIFKTQETSLSYAIHVRLNRYETLSLGFKGLYMSRSIDFSGFYTGSQYLPDRGFDPNLSNGENLAGLNKSLLTLSSGIHWQKTDRYNNKIAQAGFALFDFNKTDEGFTVAQELLSTMVFDLSFQAYKQQQLSFYPELLYTFNATNHVINAGGRWQYQLKGLPNQMPAHVDVLAKYVIGRSGILGIQFHNENFSAGISYDFPLFIKNTGNLGALEIGIQLRKLVKTRPQKLRAKRLKEQSKRQELAKKKPQGKTENTISVKSDTTNQELDVSKPVEASSNIDSTKTIITTDANAGSVTIEPLIVEKITMHFRFDFNSTDLDEESEEFLEDLAVVMLENPKLSITIKGHTDNIGSEKFNTRLSLKRAESVKHYLVKRGVAESRLTALGVGFNEPVTDNDSEAGRSKNRRVELLISHDQH